jgi:hypothetical protein
VAPTYSDSYGDETTVVKMHSGNGEHDQMDRRAIACFDLALADVGLADDGALRQVLRDYFARATKTTMSRYRQSADDVPNGLSAHTGHGTDSRRKTPRLICTTPGWWPQRRTRSASLHRPLWRNHPAGRKGRSFLSA